MQLNFSLDFLPGLTLPPFSIKKWQSKKNCFWLLSLFFLLCSPSSLWGYCNIFGYGGAEIYSLERVREGGTHQRGRVDAVYACLERRKECGWYLGVDFLYGSGIIRGKSGLGKDLKSHLTDEIVEVRFGFDLQQFCFRCPYFIPFGGWGYFRETNHFVFPSPTPWTFNDSFQYVVTGFLSGVNFTPMLSVGVNFKTRFMLDGKSKVTDDPLFDDVKLIMRNEMQVRLEVPVTYGPLHSGMGLQLMPFYEFRHFGGRPGYPFNFKDTKLYLWGARFALMYTF